MTHRYNWDASLDTGIEELDLQHRRFLHLVNHLAAAEDPDPVLAELLRHLIYHFGCEQALMDAYEVDYAAMEEAEHEAEATFVRQVIEEFRFGDRSLDALCEELYTFLAAHVRKRDQPLASAVLAKRAAI